MYTPTEEMQALTRQVVKSNDLIQKSRFSLSLQQQKIILYVISNVTPYDEDFKFYEFSVQDFCRVCGIDTGGGNYTALKAAILEIKNKDSLWVMLDGKYKTLDWISKAVIDPGSGTVKIRLDEDLKPFLLQLKDNFTSYELIWVLHFKSKYTIRLYELIKSIHFHDLDEYTREYTLDDLRRMLDAEKYTAWIHLRQRVLEPAIKEINEYSDKNVIMEPIKKARAVVSVRFTITSKDTLETEELRDRIMKEMGYEQMTLFDYMGEKGLVPRRDPAAV